MTDTDAGPSLTKMEEKSMKQKAVIVRGKNYRSFLVKGDPDVEVYGSDEVLPRLLSEGWEVVSTTAGLPDNSADSCWLVIVQKRKKHD